MTNSPITTYSLRTALFMALYVVLNIAAIVGLFDNIAPPATYILALAVTAPVVGQLWAVLDLMRTADEFIVRRVARPFIVSSVLAVAVFTGWGFMTEYASIPAAPGWLIYPLLWFFVLLTSPLMARSAA
ncbi:MAG: hypothetical protein AAFX52_01275 [Pseudomonadota bacterium]